MAVGLQNETSGVPTRIRNQMSRDRLLMKSVVLQEAEAFTPFRTTIAGHTPGMGRSNLFPMPSLWFFVIGLEIFLFARLRIAEADIWFHLRNAQQLLTSHKFLRYDLYTFTSSGVPLLNFEWLAELPYYFAFRSFGLRGVLAIYLALLWIVFGGAYYLALRRGANAADAALVSLAAVAVGSYSFGPRMLHFGWLCLIGVMIVLERFERTGRGL
jgi:hypothetical protein